MSFVSSRLVLCPGIGLDAWSCQNLATQRRIVPIVCVLCAQGICTMGLCEPHGRVAQTIDPVSGQATCATTPRCAATRPNRTWHLVQHTRPMACGEAGKIRARVRGTHGGQRINVPSP